MQDVKNTQNTQPTDLLKNKANIKTKADGKSTTESFVLHSVQPKNDNDRVR